MITRHQSFAIKEIFLLVSAIALAFYTGRQIPNGIDFHAILPLLILLSVFVLLNPRLGIYAFSFTLILVPYSWRIFKLSPNSLLVGAALVGLAALVVLKRRSLNYSEVYVSVGVAVLVAWLNFVRYGEPVNCAICGFNVPFILTEGLILLVLSYHLIQTRQHLHKFLIALSLAVVVRTALDVSLAIHSFLAGHRLGAIRSNQLIVDVSSTTESAWHSLLLPLFLALVLLFRKRSSRFLFTLALLLSVGWLPLAVTRTGMVGLVLTPLFMFILLPAAVRGRLLRSILPLGLVVIYLAVIFSGVWSIVVAQTQLDLERGWDFGRPAAWRDAFEAFLQSPLWGDSPGPSHSYFLGTARYMGLLFLVPFGVTLWFIWCHGAWLRRQPLDAQSQALVVGLQAGLLISIVLNLIGTMFQGAVPAFFFWLLVGVQEALYLDVRTGRHAIVQKLKEQQTYA